VALPTDFEGLTTIAMHLKDVSLVLSDQYNTVLSG
jgi:hypothetical protein